MKMNTTLDRLLPLAATIFFLLLLACGPAHFGKRYIIPKDLDDSLVKLDGILSTENIEKIKDSKEEDLVQFHMGLGLWIRNSWRLWANSRLKKWFNAKGIHHPDDMSGIIIDSYWRKLNGKPIALDEQVKSYKIFWDTTKVLPEIPIPFK